MTADRNVALDTIVSARLCANAIATCLFTNSPISEPATAQPGIAVDRFAPNIGGTCAARSGALAAAEGIPLDSSSVLRSEM
jgi:hypothetical protein